MYTKSRENKEIFRRADLSPLVRMERRTGRLAERLIIPHKRRDFAVNYRVTLSVIPGEFLLRFILRHREFFHGHLLDVGCGTRPYLPIYGPRVGMHVSIDVPTSLHGLENVDVVASSLQLPFTANVFHTVVCTEVAEHVPDPVRMLREINRVCKLGGILFISVPFLYGLHEYPHDFHRFTVYGLKGLLESTGFEILRFEARGGLGTAIFSFVIVVLKTLLGLDKLERKGFNFLDRRWMRLLFGWPQWVFLRLYSSFFPLARTASRALTRSEMYGSLGYCAVARKVKD